jgi:hypothetical protein
LAGLVLHRYKDFLDSVTPAEWFVAQAEKQEVSKALSDRGQQALL